MTEKRLNVFISSPSKDLAPYRLVARETVEGLKGLHAVVQEGFGARTAPPEEFCPEEVRRCELFILLFGKAPGSSPQGSEKSYTELEYEAALDENKPHLAFLTSARFELPPGVEISEEERRKAEAFRERIQKTCTPIEFTTRDELSARLAQAIWNWAVETRFLLASLRPFNVPPDISPFFGREKEMNYLEGNLHPGRPIAFCGQGGIGKTALAIRAAYRFRERFPDGVIWLDLTYTTAEDAISAIASAYDLKPEPGKTGETLRGFLHDKKALLILDDAQSPEQVSEIIKYAGTCATLITSRHREVAAVGDLRDTKPLDERPALELLAHHRGKAFSDEELETAKKICAKLGYLPLALRLAGSHMKIYCKSPERYLELFEKGLEEALHLGETKDLSVVASFNISYEELNDEEKRAFALLSWHKGDFGLEAAMAGLNWEEDKTEKTLDRLLALSLLEAGEGRYRYHPLLRTYAQEKKPEGWEEAEARLADYYFVYAQAHRRKTAADYNALEAELENLQAGMEWCKEQEMWEQVRDYARAAYWFLSTRAYWDRLMGWLQAWKEACEEIGDKAGLA
ncbi:MAG: DUF4062 domain-containing protein, partial [Anaerolineae bacterium]